MKIPIFIMPLIFIISGCVITDDVERNFQHDADLLRLEHLVYWTGIVEEYYDVEGHFPFQNTLETESELGLVKIATKEQRGYLSPGSSNYNSDLDNNSSGRFIEFSITDFIKEIETVLGRSIDEKYDIQRVPSNSPIGYFYFYTNDGYLIWTTCITCGVTPISTLLLNGYTPTVNIVSDGMKGKVTKALTREEMLAHPIFKAWIEESFYKEGYGRSVVESNKSDSKK